MKDEMLDWLIKRAEEEESNIAKLKLSWPQRQTTSKKVIELNEKEANKSIGRLEMILEILKENNKQ